MRRCSCQNAGCATRKISRRAVARGGEIPRFFILNYCLHFGAGRSLTLKPNAKKPIGRTKVNCWGWGWGTGWRARFAPRSVASQSPRTRARVCPPHLLRLSPPFRHCARRFAPRSVAWSCLAHGHGFALTPPASAPAPAPARRRRLGRLCSARRQGASS